MSLARTALRLAAIEALRPAASLAADGPWPTLARHRVYDAKIDQIDDLALKDRAPVVSVYTDDDESQTAHSGPPFKRFVELCFELSIAQMAPSPDDPDLYEAAVPVTDAESEASLDLLESAIKFALMYGPTGRILRTVTGNRIEKITSKPTRTGEEAVRLAMRSLTMRVQIDDDCFDLAPLANATGLDRLPQPLRGVVQALGETSYGRAIGTALAAASPAAPVPTRPFSVAADIDATVPADDEPDMSAVITPPQT